MGTLFIYSCTTCYQIAISKLKMRLVYLLLVILLISCLNLSDGCLHHIFGSKKKFHQRLHQRKQRQRKNWKQKRCGETYLQIRMELNNPKIFTILSGKKPESKITGAVITEDY